MAFWGFTHFEWLPILINIFSFFVFDINIFVNRRTFIIIVFDNSRRRFYALTWLPYNYLGGWKITWIYRFGRTFFLIIRRKQRFIQHHSCWFKLTIKHAACFYFINSLQQIRWPVVVICGLWLSIIIIINGIELFNFLFSVNISVSLNDCSFMVHFKTIHYGLDFRHIDLYL